MSVNPFSEENVSWHFLRPLMYPRIIRKSVKSDGSCLPAERAQTAGGSESADPADRKGMISADAAYIEITGK